MSKMGKGKSKEKTTTETDNMGHQVDTKNTQKLLVYPKQTKASASPIITNAQSTASNVVSDSEMDVRAKLDAALRCHALSNLAAAVSVDWMWEQTSS